MKEEVWMENTDPEPRYWVRKTFYSCYDKWSWQAPCYFCKDICYLGYEPERHYRCGECSVPSSRYYLEDVPDESGNDE